METLVPGTAELELDSEELFEALDRERRHRHLTRAQASAELGISPTSWSSWSSGATIGAGSALRASIWLRRDLRDFVKPRAARPPATWALPRSMRPEEQVVPPTGGRADALPAVPGLDVPVRAAPGHASPRLLSPAGTGPD